MLWMGFTRPKAPVWGPFVSKLRAQEITLPLRTRVAARLITSGVMKLSVPISSSGPQRPQLRNFLQYSSSSRSEEHTSELQSLAYLVCRLLLEKKKTYSAYKTFSLH